MARRTLRPMRPKPEIAILTAIGCSILPLRRRSPHAPAAAGNRSLSCGVPLALSMRQNWSDVNNAAKLQPGTVTDAFVDDASAAPIVAATEGRVSPAAALRTAADSRRWPGAAQPRRGGKSATVAARRSARKAKDEPAVGTLGERLAAVERERNALKEELERAQVAPAPAGGNASPRARPHRLGPRFPPQHPRRQGLTPSPAGTSKPNLPPAK